MGTIAFSRPRRVSGPPMPRGDLLLESPPEIPPPATGRNWGAILRMLPMLAGAGAMAMMMTSSGGGGRGPMGAVMGGMYGISMLGMMMTQMGRGNDDQAQELDAARRDYFRYLGQMRKRVRETAGEQRRATVWIHPDPANLWAVAGTRRMWERRTTDDDFGSIRIGLGTQDFVQRITPPESKPIEDLEPLTVGALRRFMSTHRRVPSVPTSIDVPSYRSLSVFGSGPDSDDRARRLAYAMVSQMAAWHAPTDLRIIVCVAPERERDWQWTKWLPHTQHPTRTDGVGPVRLFATSTNELMQVAEGAGGSIDGEAPSHVVLLIDGLDGVSAAQFSGPGTSATTFEVGRLTEPPRRLDPDAIALEVDTDGMLTAHLRRSGQGVVPRDIGPADAIPMVSAEMLARGLAGYRMPEGAQVESEEVEDVEEPVFEAPKDYPSMLGTGDPASLEPEDVWRPRPLQQRLRVPVGNGLNGQPVELDIKEAAMNGMGPHGLCIGATGSGKSEFLRTLVLGLAMTHPPDQLNYVLVDFKGGATFAGLEELPHVSAVITNLEGELTLVDRMQDAIGGEMDRRMEVLSETNAKLRNRDIKNREEYDAARLDGADIPPMPSLFIVVDEFSELLTARPEFIDLFIQIGRIGRSIGVHLLLASQRLEEGKLRGLDTYLSYRIALRTFSPQESRTVIGVPDAYELPSAPGNGYLKYDTTGMVQFKAAYVSGPWRGTSGAPVRTGGARLEDASADDGEQVWVPPVLEFSPHHVMPVLPPEPEPEVVPEPQTQDEDSGDEALEGEVIEEADAEDEEEDEETLLSVVVGRLIGQGWPAHKVWLPPLDDPTTLDQLVGTEITELPGRGLTIADSRFHGRLQAPVALVDRPRQQRRDPMWLDFSGSAGHMGIAGGPQSGKSTAIRTVVSSLALTHTPDEVGFYCLDFGGGSLSSLREFPHVGSVCGRLDVDRVKRTVAEITSLLNQREVAFAEHDVESMTAYRRGRANGSIPRDRFATDVFLVVDGWLTIKQEFDELETVITQLAQRGLGFGIHVIAASGKWSEFRLNIRDLLQSRIELRMGDPFESEVNRKLAVNVPTGRPGRGMTSEGLHLLVGLPRIDSVTDADSLAEGARAMAQAVKHAWRGEPAAPVRMLPESLPPQNLPTIGYDGQNRRWPWAIDELELAPTWFDAARDPHLVLFGAPESGKSTVIRTMLNGIVATYRPDEAKILLLDYKRSHLGLVPDDYLLGYCASSSAATEQAKNVAAAVKTRLPGPNVTQEELRNKSWWKGIQVFVVVDDYELVGVSMGNPLSPFFELVSQAEDIGLHIILARGMGGAGRAAYSDQIIARMRDQQSPGLIMSGTRDEGALYGDVKPFPLPPGRGTLISRAGKVLVQTVNTPEQEF